MRNIVVVFGLTLLYSCIVPLSPKRDHYKLIGDEKSEFNSFTGYIYKNEKYIINLWVFSTNWKTIYLSTNLPIEDSVKVMRKGKTPIYLKKKDSISINKLPYNLYHNDSVFVYSKTIKMPDNDWYRKKISDTLNVEINNKVYKFYLDFENNKNMQISK